MSELAAALVAAQAELPLSLRRDADGQIGERGYRYVTFDALVEATRPILNKHGIAIVQSVTDRTLVTVLEHESGDFLNMGGLPLLVPSETMQGLGAAITYARRYAWAAALGIASEEDDDAASVSNAPEAEGAEWTWRSGKHKGTTLGATPADYLAWYVQNGPDPVARAHAAGELARHGFRAGAVDAAPDDDTVPF